MTSFDNTPAFFARCPDDNTPSSDAYHRSPSADRQTGSWVQPQWPFSSASAGSDTCPSKYHGTPTQPRCNMETTYRRDLILAGFSGNLSQSTITPADRWLVGRDRFIEELEGLDTVVGCYLAEYTSHRLVLADAAML